MQSSIPDDTRTASKPSSPVPQHLRAQLLPLARKVFWWGTPEEWLDDTVRFTAQVMTFGDLNDLRITLELLGDSAFRAVLANPPPGVFDIKSWNFWHLRYQLEVPPLPTRKLQDHVPAAF